ncbi:MAG: hypothetical protein EOO07_31550 [Chitinophagaceae bacterium]|nr:MAG: hypothetical protein EOO07_31550 [Chitinophagaceae bacterium]
MLKNVVLVAFLGLCLLFFASYTYRPSKALPRAKKRVVFTLGNYSSELDNFRDTAVKALALMSEVFSSKEFKDSLDKYSFPCSNAWFKENICKTPKNIIVYKCDSAANVVHGQTVYEDMLMEKKVTLDLNIIHPKGKTNSYGFSAACVYKINTYSWWLKNDRKQPLSEEYAIHLAHEYCHIVGYFHSSYHKLDKDVSYRMGGIVRNILWRWSQERIKN